MCGEGVVYVMSGVMCGEGVVYVMSGMMCGEGVVMCGEWDDVW